MAIGHDIINQRNNWKAFEFSGVMSITALMRWILAVSAIVHCIVGCRFQDN